MQSFAGHFLSSMYRQEVLKSTWADEKQGCEESEKRRKNEKDQRMRKSEKEDPGVQEGRKGAIGLCFFQWFVRSN